MKVITLEIWKEQPQNRYVTPGVVKRYPLARVNQGQKAKHGSFHGGFENTCNVALHPEMTHSILVYYDGRKFQNLLVDYPNDFHPKRSIQTDSNF
jgi:hypothetical protein